MDWVPCRLSHLLIEEQTDSQVIYLSEIDGERRLPIVIGPMEASAIHRAVRGEHFARPLTHDLLAAFIEETGCDCRDIRVVDIQDGTYYAEIRLQTTAEDSMVAIDCRPSDAIALLVRLPGTDLLVADHVFDAGE